MRERTECYTPENGTDVGNFHESSIYIVGCNLLRNYDFKPPPQLDRPPPVYLNLDGDTTEKLEGLVDKRNGGGESV